MLVLLRDSRARVNTWLFAVKIAPTQSTGTVRYHMLVGRTISCHRQARRIAAYVGPTLLGRQKPLSHNITDRIRNATVHVAVVFATSMLSILRWVNSYNFSFEDLQRATTLLSSSSSYLMTSMTTDFHRTKILDFMCRSTWILIATPVLAHYWIHCLNISFFVLFLLQYPCVSHNF